MRSIAGQATRSSSKGTRIPFILKAAGQPFTRADFAATFGWRNPEIIPKLFGSHRSHDEIARLGLGTAEQRNRWMHEMAALFPDVNSGQTISGIHLPGAETRFYLDGVPLGRIEDPEFGPAFFAIWLDPRTREPALRERLLQRADAHDARR